MVVGKKTGELIDEVVLQNEQTAVVIGLLGVDRGEVGGYIGESEGLVALGGDFNGYARGEDWEADLASYAIVTSTRDDPRIGYTSVVVGVGCVGIRALQYAVKTVEGAILR